MTALVRFCEDPVRVLMFWIAAIILTLTLTACSALPDASMLKTYPVSAVEEQGPHHIYARQGRQGAFAPE